MKDDPRFMPYKTPEDVLNAFRNIQGTINPNLKNLFGHTPKMKFEIRQTEAFRAASASAEYEQGSPDGTRPGIFYVPILDATKFNTTSGMESLFLHEAIPGHHYQMSLQLEDTLLPIFRRFHGMVHLEKDGHYILSRWEKNWASTPTRTNLWVHWEKKYIGPSGWL